MGKNIGENKTKNWSSKHSQKPLARTKQFAIDALKTVLKNTIQKTAKATGDLIGNEIADNITKVPQKTQQNNSETIVNQNY